jgi:histidinol dehydrogenase
MSRFLFRRLGIDQVRSLGRRATDPEVLSRAVAIVEDVRTNGEDALRAHAERLGDLASGDPLVFGRDALTDALDSIPTEQRALLERTAERIRSFARAQRSVLGSLEVALPGGAAGHSVVPVERAGCYAPGGRFPLPSSVLMTALTAATAGVNCIWIASPRPARITLAAAGLAGATGLLAVGGAQAIAALAYGAGPIPACDAVVGPGNRWVTAAKQLVSGRVAIDMLAGPSELVVVADGSSDPNVVAADLIAQAEHDPDAWPVLISLDVELIDRVERRLEERLIGLPTAESARAALENGFAVFVTSPTEAIGVCDCLAPEHLELCIEGAKDMASRLNHYGALFIGAGAAEVLADYGAGPNHVLPTGGTARFTGGLSVSTFLRTRTWLRIDDLESVQPLVSDAAAFARLEGLEAHARAAELRQVG